MSYLPSPQPLPPVMVKYSVVRESSSAWVSVVETVPIDGERHCVVAKKESIISG